MKKNSIEVNPLQESFGQHLDKIEDSLWRELNLYSWSEFYAPLKYACEGGKRIRPLILTLAAETVGECNGDAYLAATAIELLHTESIIHDDIVDEEKERRGKKTFHLKYGYNMSILTADFVLGIILNIASKLKDHMVANELANASLKMSEGEMLEVRLSSEQNLLFEDYLNVITYKTASLFEAASKIGAIIGGGTEKQISILTNFGRNLGIAYQINDDLMDWRNEERLFNVLMKNNHEPSIEEISKMQTLLSGYTNRADEQLRLLDGEAKHNLKDLIGLTLFK